MKIALILTLTLLSSISFGQKIKFKINNYDKDTTVNLVRYFGKGLYYADTAEMKNGVVEFDGKGKKHGILALYLPDQNILEFIYNGEPEVSIEGTYPTLMKDAKVKKSEENKIFHSYVQFIGKQRIEANKHRESQKNLDPESDEFKALSDKIAKTNENVVNYQNELIKNHGDKLVAGIVKISMDIDIPESPKDKDGNEIDKSFRFNYYRAHYFDNIDLNDDRLVRTSVFHNKLSKYFGRDMMIQQPDTIIKYAYDLCDRLTPGSDMYHYIVSWITSEYEKSQIMGMDKVFVRMAERYYIPLDENGNHLAFWVPKASMEKIIEKVQTNQRLVLGEVPPNIILRDSTDQQWRDFYSLDKEYTILYFWDPQCGHCTKITPKLQTLYEKKFKDRNIEIFAVGKAVGDDFENWKKFIKKHNLEFINVAVTDQLFRDASDKSNNQAKLKELLRTTTIESLNYQKTYDVFSTPRVFILDKDKKIIAKRLSVSQLEDLIDRLQGKSDLEKLFPREKEDPEESQMH